MNIKLVISFTFLLLFSFNINLFTQSEAALPFLTLPVSPLNAGMGTTGTSLPSNDVFGFLSNPAQLGYLSQHTNLSVQLYPEESKIGDVFSYNSLAFNLGYNFEKLIGYPLSLGIGYNRTTNELLFLQDNIDSYNAFSFGVGIDYYVEFSAGYTFKDISSELGDVSARVSAYDIGFLLNVPVTKLIIPEYDLNFSGTIELKPELNFSVGYAQSNIGDKIYYIDPAQSDPLPRTAKMGYSVSVGFKEVSMKIPLEIFHLDFSAEAKDYLINRDITGASSYQPAFGDINIAKNIFGIKGDDNVYANSGFKIELLETAVLMRGHSGRSYGLSSSNGYGLKAGGLFKVFADN
ncbi:MAG TPA: hypothetical protein VLB50_13690, partial [Ignavibacteriaceae bacterium]|nr:hypothetical protein [Ignavibacteriaceae bacterium]